MEEDEEKEDEPPEAGTPGTLAAKDDPGCGILVDAKGGRLIGDTNSSAVFLEDLPLNFHGGDEALHFALGKLFGTFGKIKKIDLYTEDGQMGVQDFTGQALVVYHRSKQTGTREKGDAVYDACSACDGKFHLLGWKHWRITCEAAVWQREGYNVKDKDKVLACVELTNLWEYDADQPIGYYIGLQNVILEHAKSTCDSVYVKVDPMTGTALVWPKGAQDCMKFASQMHKSYFMGRKVVASLCRRAKPKLDDWDGIKDYTNSNKSTDSAIEKARAAGTFTLFPNMDKFKPPVHDPGAEPAPMDVGEALADAFAEDIKEVTPAPVKAMPFRLKQGARVKIKDLEAKPEYNGKTGDVLKWMSDIQKYQVQIDFGKKVKVRVENVELLDELSTNEAMFTCEHKAAQREDKEEEALKAHLAAQAMAAKMAPKAIADGATAEDFKASVCVDASLLKKSADEEARLKREEEEAAEARRRQRSRSRDRIQKERLDAAKARLAEAGEPRSKWIVTGPAPAAAAAKAAGEDEAPQAPKEPQESREELMKMSVSKLKALLIEFGKHARGCLEKRDFVDRLKPPPKE